MYIGTVADIIKKISDGFEDACAECLETNSGIVIHAIQEQLYSGIDGNDEHLSPTYDDDPFFNEEGFWHNRGKDYKAWKNLITPPMATPMLGLPPRPENVPNLFIDGTFYSEITAARRERGLEIEPGAGNGVSIISKYGDSILNLGITSVDFFNTEYMLPAIDRFFKECGYE